MQQDQPLAPVQDYPRSDMEFGGINPKASRREEKSSKCLVYVLAIMVIQGAVLLIFGTIFLRATTPGFEFGSVRVQNLKYRTSSSSPTPSFTFTLVTVISIENTNFGEFRFDNTTGAIWCGPVVVGEFKIPTGRAQARATERLYLSVEVSSLRVPNTTGLSSNISSGLLDLSSHAKLSGKLNIMNIIKRTRHPELNCFMKLNFTGGSVHGLTCD